MAEQLERRSDRAPARFGGLDYAPAPGTSLSVDGAPLGAPIEGEAFFRALLRTWVGQNPAQEDLKRALLGQGG